MNLLAEILCFADRKFYSDWWNAKNGKEFFRLSNHIVQDFAYKFIYCDLKKYLDNRHLRSILTFAISGMFHDLILTISFGFFIPVLTISMTTQRIFTILYEKDFIWNNKFCFIMGISASTSVMIANLQMEYYTRQNSNYNYGFFIPCFWRNITF
jgi:hypothetical protein